MDRTANDRAFRPGDIGPTVRSTPPFGCERGIHAENFAHDMEAVEVMEGGPTVLYCKRGCGTTLKLEVPS
jgi:hypothetical protein